jgi:hypothetical protein
LENDWEEADTALVPERNAVKTILNSESCTNCNRGVAYYAVTLTHELFLHAIGDLKFLDESGPYKTQDEDHALIYTPASNSNAYLQVIRQVLARLPDNRDLKKEFLHEYCRDVSLYVRDDDGNIQDPEVAAWLKQLEQAANDPDDAIWTGNTFNAFVTRLKSASLPVQLERFNPNR